MKGCLFSVAFFIIGLFSAMCQFSNRVEASVDIVAPTIEQIKEVPRFSVIEELISLDGYDFIQLNDEQALLLLVDLGVQHPYVALAQMKLESGNYSSAIANSNNNYFGMRHPAQRITVSLGSKNGYAKYRNWAYSVLDYALWQRQYAWNLTENDYIAKLGRTYAQDPNYTVKVKNIAKNLENKK